MREKQLKEFLRGELNSIEEININTQSINEIVSSLWEKSEKNFLLCRKLINDLPENITKTKKFKNEGLIFLDMIEGSIKAPAPVRKKSGLAYDASINVSGTKKQANSELFEELVTPKGQRNSPTDKFFFKLFIDKIRENATWAIVAVCALIFVAVDLQDPIQIHPEVKGWKTLKIGMPISEARNELRKYCEDIEHSTSTDPTGYECGYHNGYPASIKLHSQNKYLFWNYLEGISLNYDGMSYFHYNMLHKQLRKKFGSPVSDNSDCLNKRGADCLAMFADKSVWLSKSSYKNHSTVGVSYWRSWD